VRPTQTGGRLNVYWDVKPVLFFMEVADSRGVALAKVMADPVARACYNATADPLEQEPDGLELMFTSQDTMGIQYARMRYHITGKYALNALDAVLQVCPYIGSKTADTPFIDNQLGNYGAMGYSAVGAAAPTTISMRSDTFMSDFYTLFGSDPSVRTLSMALRGVCVGGDTMAGLLSGGVANFWMEGAAANTDYSAYQAAVDSQNGTTYTAQDGGITVRWKPVGDELRYRVASDIAPDLASTTYNAGAGLGFGLPFILVQGSANMVVLRI
jgi:hypothetical protein